MEVFTRRITVNAPTINIAVIADAHAGSIACDWQLLKQAVEYIRQTPNCLWYSAGDLWEGILPGDPRFDLVTFDWEFHEKGLQVIPYVQKAFLEKMIELFDPIKDKCIGLAIGNHERKAGGGVLAGLTMALCDALRTDKNPGLRFLGWTWQCRLIFKHSRRKIPERLIIFMSEHGTGGGQTKGWKAQKLDRRLGQFPRPDVLVKGHVHDLMIIANPDIGCHRDPSPEYDDFYDSRLRWGANCPSMMDAYKKGKILYPEWREHQPAVKGLMEIHINLWDYRYPMAVPRYALLKLPGMEKPFDAKGE